jgi:hypothetical protein
MRGGALGAKGSNDGRVYAERVVNGRDSRVGPGLTA